MKNEDKIEISDYGNLLVYKSSYSINFIKKAIEKYNLNGLRIFDYSDVLKTLSFLKEFTFLKRLDISCRYDQDYSFLKYLNRLESLAIYGSLTIDNKIDLNSQVNLVELTLNWRKKIEGLEKCSNLQRLILVEFKEKDLKKIVPCATKIRELIIKTSSIESLDGIESFVKLENLAIGNARKLQMIEQILLLENLKYLQIETCPKIINKELIKKYEGCYI